MVEPEDITGLPAFAQGVIAGMRQAIREKWNEAAITFFARAVVNMETAKACQYANALDASDYFAKKTIWLTSQALFCLGKASGV